MADRLSASRVYPRPLHAVPHPAPFLWSHQLSSRSQQCTADSRSAARDDTHDSTSCCRIAALPGAVAGSVERAPPAKPSRTWPTPSQPDHSRFARDKTRWWLRHRPASAGLPSPEEQSPDSPSTGLAASSHCDSQSLLALKVDRKPQPVAPHKSPHVSEVFSSPVHLSSANLPYSTAAVARPGPSSPICISLSTIDLPPKSLLRTLYFLFAGALPSCRTIPGSLTSLFSSPQLLFS